MTKTKSEEELPSLETNNSVPFVPSGNMERYSWREVLRLYFFLQPRLVIDD